MATKLYENTKTTIEKLDQEKEMDSKIFRNNEKIIYLKNEKKKNLENN